jgi:hypothetical protein
MKQHLPALSTDATAWLEQTFARNRSLYGGWSMEDKPADKPEDRPADKPEDKPADKPADAPDDKGFPANTPVAEMTPAQQAAYHQHQSRKHEGRAKDWSQAFPGKTAAEIKAIVDAAEASRRNTLTLDEKTIEDAKADARKAALAEIGPKAVKSAFDLLLGDMPEQEKDEHIDTLDLSKFLTDDNEVDTAKVRAHVARIQPDKGQGSQGRDFGQGRRGGSSASAGGVAAVMEARRAERESKTKK